MVRKEFTLPDVGEGVAEGELVSWLVEPGDGVTENQPIAEVETDKAMVEIPSDYDGTIVELRAEEGETIQVGEVMVVFEIDEDETTADDESVSREDDEPVPDRDGETSVSDGRVLAPPRVRRLARELGVDVADVAGSGPGGRLTEADVRDAAEQTASAVDADESGEPEVRAELAPTASGRTRTLAMPATRRLAREEGVDIDRVPASETRDGEPFVTPEDVQSVLREDDRAVDSIDRAEPEAAAETAADVAEGPQSGDRIPYRGVRRSIGEQMVESKYTAPHVSHHDEVEVSALVDLRERLKEVTAERDVRLTYLPFAVKATVAALKEFPVVNSSLDEEEEEIVLHDEYNVGIAVATDAGLLVPVIDDADQKGLLELARDIDEKATRARDRSIALEEMQGGTFTITNVGAIGGEHSTPIINHPETAILALGTLQERPWVEDGEVVARPTLPLSMSVDHRVIDGAVAARFTNEVKRYLHDPELLLLE